MNVSRIYRLLRIISLLQSGRGYTAGELAAELNVSRRTVFRDLNAMEMAHIPYYFDAETQSYRIQQHFFLPPVNLTLPEALSLLTLTARLKDTEAMPLMSHCTKAALKVENSLPPAIRHHVGTMIGKLNVRLSPLARHAGVDKTFDDIASAIVERKPCRIKYHSFAEGRLIVTVIHPMRMVFVGRAWYVIARSLSERELRTFKLVRIEQLELLTGRFKAGNDVDLEKYFGDAWCMIPEGKIYDIHLRFAKKVAGNVAEVNWHHSQRTQINDDGTLDFHARVDGLGEIFWWVLGYGDQVTVLSPPALAKRVKDVALNVVNKYRKECREK